MVSRLPGSTSPPEAVLASDGPAPEPLAIEPGPLAIERELYARIRETIEESDFSDWFASTTCRFERPNEPDERGRFVLSTQNSFQKRWIDRHYAGLLRDTARSLIPGEPEVELRIATVSEAPAPPRTTSPEPAARDRVRQDRTPENRTSPSPSTAGRRGLRESVADADPAPAASALHPAHTFDHFLVTTGNRVAHAACLAVCEPRSARSSGPAGEHPPSRAAALAAERGRDSSDYNPLFIYGDHGSGKTHLLQAACHRARAAAEDHRDAHEAPASDRTLYLSAEEFTNHYLVASRARGPSSEDRPESATARASLPRLPDSVDLLVLDDVHFFAAKKRSLQNRFHEVLSTLLEDGRQVILGSSRSPSGLADHIEARLLSRFRCGLVVRLDLPDLPTRARVATRKASARGYELPQVAAEYLAAQSGPSFRDVDGALAQVLASAEGLHDAARSTTTPSARRSPVPGRGARSRSLPTRCDTPRTISLELARDALRERSAADSALAGNASEGVTVARILAVVQDHFRIKPRDLLARTKVRTIVRARQVGMHLARELTSLSLEEIGLHFGGRDHSTVFYSLDRIRRLEGEDPDLRATIHALQIRLGG